MSCQFLLRRYPSFCEKIRQCCKSLQAKQYCSTKATNEAKDSTICIKWKLKDGSIVETQCKAESNLMRLAHRYGIELEGACEGVCACSTCHVILENSVYMNLPEPTEKEEDMLDQAFGPTPTSRLGCQIEITNELNGILVTLPKATRNFYVDGHVPKPH